MQNEITTRTHLGWLEVPAILVDIPEQLAKERAIRARARAGAVRTNR